MRPYGVPAAWHVVPAGRYFSDDKKDEIRKIYTFPHTLTRCVGCLPATLCLFFVVRTPATSEEGRVVVWAFGLLLSVKASHHTIHPIHVCTRTKTNNPNVYRRAEVPSPASQPASVSFEALLDYRPMQHDGRTVCASGSGVYLPSQQREPSSRLTGSGDLLLPENVTSPSGSEQDYAAM